MSYLNTPIPVVEAYIRGNFLRNQEDSHDNSFSYKQKLPNLNLWNGDKWVNL
jgi:hypothetical protein